MPADLSSHANNKHSSNFHIFTPLEEIPLHHNTSKSQPQPNLNPYQCPLFHPFVPHLYHPPYYPCPCALLITHNAYVLHILTSCLYNYDTVYHSNNRFPLFVLFIFCTSDVVIYYFNNLQCEENKRLFIYLFNLKKL